MTALRGLIAWLLGAGMVSAGAVSLGVLLLPAAADGPVVPPISSPPGWVVQGEKI